MKKKFLLAAALAAVTATGAFAQANDTFAKVKAAGKVVMGTRESSAPLAYTTGGAAAPLNVAGLQRPSAVAVDASGRAAVLDTKSQQVVFTAGGAPLLYREAGLERPTALAFGWDGVLHLYDDASGTWVRFP